jgi:1,5-anhydro-D-fructose reductase (1,5-anhydro-D-mannitol-forming)
MRQIAWGLIGCGDIARRRVGPALRDLESCRFLALARARAERAAECAAELGAERAYGTWQELLLDEDVQAVYIATPPHLHAGIAVAAAGAGKHVVCEKPMAPGLEEADAMIAACRAAGVRLSVAYYRHLYPVMARIREILSSGKIGTPLVAQINAFEHHALDPGDPRSWLLDPEISGGGAMIDFGCHRIEVLLDLLGDVEEIQGMTSRRFAGRAVEDTASALLRFRKGALGLITVSTVLEELKDSLDIFGSEGSLHVPVLNRGLFVVRNSSGEREESCPCHENLHRPYLQAVTEALLEGQAPPVSGELGREVTRIITEIYRRGEKET